MTKARDFCRDLAGVRQCAIARQTGRLVVVYDGIEAGFDTSGGRWQTVCEDHGWILAHDTLALAKRHAADPLGWCEPCMVLAGLKEPHPGLEWALGEETLYLRWNPAPTGAEGFADYESALDCWTERVWDQNEPGDLYDVRAGKWIARHHYLGVPSP